MGKESKEPFQKIGSVDKEIMTDDDFIRELEVGADFCAITAKKIVSKHGVISTKPKIEEKAIHIQYEAGGGIPDDFKICRAAAFARQIMGNEIILLALDKHGNLFIFRKSLFQKDYRWNSIT